MIALFKERLTTNSIYNNGPEFVIRLQEN